MLIFYAKRFLPSGTTIEAKPFRTNTDMSTKYQCMKYFSRRWDFNLWWTWIDQLLSLRSPQLVSDSFSSIFLSFRLKKSFHNGKIFIYDFTAMPKALNCSLAHNSSCLCLIYRLTQTQTDRQIDRHTDTRKGTHTQ